MCDEISAVWYNSVSLRSFPHHKTPSHIISRDGPLQQNDLMRSKVGRTLSKIESCGNAHRGPLSAGVFQTFVNVAHSGPPEFQSLERPPVCTRRLLLWSRAAPPTGTDFRLRAAQKACGEGRAVEIRARVPAKIYMSRRGSFFPRLFFHRPIESSRRWPQPPRNRRRAEHFPLVAAQAVH